MGSERRRTRKPRYERRIVTLALLTGLPAVILALVLLWSGDLAARTQLTLTILLVAVWLAFVGVVRERVVRPLQSISNMLAALRERDFSLRARASDPGDAPRVLEIAFPGRPGLGRWELRRGTLRQGGLPHQLLVLADVSRALSEEERQAWQRLIRVLSHELNNSLAPIKSIAQSLAELVRRDPLAPDWREDLHKGLGVIGGRAESLSRLMAAYARLARLPRPRLEPVPVAEWVRRVAALETRVLVTVCPGPEVTIQADGGQLDQLLINLVRN